MNVRCESCQTVYRVDPAKVPDGGVRVRCAVCPATLTVTRDLSAAAPAPAVVGTPAPVPSAPPAPPTADTRPAPEAPPADRPAAATPRLSQPFFQPRVSRIPHTPPASGPSRTERPSAPVFRPTPGQPVTKAPVAPPVAPPALPHPDVAAPPAGGTPPAPVADAPVPKKPVNPFLQRDPRQKARRLARALVSDMIVYQPEKRQQALAAGNVKEAFDDEIQKSWEEYVEQIGEELASNTSFWTEALNEILAGGQQIF